MRLTKYEHSCVVLEQDSESLVIDAGPLSNSFVAPNNCVGIVVTHEHFDHLDQEKLKAIIAQCPDVKLFVNEGLKARLESELQASVTVISPGESQTVGSFSLLFTGGLHEPIRPGVPQCKNTGVIVNQLFYHPGDQYFVPDEPYVWLGLPLNAPWAKVSDTTAFVTAAKAKHVMSIHNGLLNDTGIATYENHVVAVCNEVGSDYKSVSVGETIELE